MGLVFEKITETKEIDKVVDLFCCQCGKSLRNKDDMDYEHTSFRANWGYGSSMDDVK